MPYTTEETKGWPLAVTRAQVEYALDHRRLVIQGHSGRWYDVRRNGKTKTWKTRPYDYSIPAKVGLSGAFRIDPDTSNLMKVRPDHAV
jgi:hypothetical protein